MNIAIESPHKELELRVVIWEQEVKKNLCLIITGAHELKWMAHWLLILTSYLFVV